MKYLMFIFSITLCFVSSSAFCNTQTSYSSAYLDAFNAALKAPLLANQCRDLTDEEMEEAENRPGGGYSDGKWGGENPPMNEDENGNPTYAVQQVWEDDEGNLIILDTEGEIIEIIT